MVCVRDRMTFSRVLALVLMLCVCVLNVIPLSNVTPRMVGVLVYGMGVLFSVTSGCAVYSLLCGVISVRDDLFVETFILFVVSQFSSVCVYSCSCVAAVSYLGCCESIVRSSAYVMR